MEKHQPHLSACSESSHLGKLKVVTGTTSSGLEAHFNLLLLMLLLLLLYKVKGSWEIGGVQNKWRGSPICHTCLVFLRILSAHACSSLNCEIGIARRMLHFRCQDASHDGTQGRGTAFGAGERNVAGDKHSWHVTIVPIKSWFSPTAHFLSPHAYKCCCQGHCKYYCRKLLNMKNSFKLRCSLSLR